MVSVINNTKGYLRNLKGDCTVIDDLDCKKIEQLERGIYNLIDGGAWERGFMFTTSEKTKEKLDALLSYYPDNEQFTKVKSKLRSKFKDLSRFKEFKSNITQSNRNFFGIDEKVFGIINMVFLYILSFAVAIQFYKLKLERKLE